MDVPRPKCLLCGGPLAQGFVLDKSRGFLFPAAWVEGTPQPHWMGGIKVPDQEHPITAMRCTKCGFLMHFTNAMA